MKTDPNLHKKHKSDLGYDIPDGFFKDTKATILETIKEEKTVEKKIFFLKKPVYQIAASVIVLFGMMFLYKIIETNNSTVEIEQKIVNQVEEVPNTMEDLYIESLMSEEGLDGLVDNYIITNILEETKVNVEDYEDMIIDSFLSEDSEVDEQINQFIMSEIVL